MQASQNQSYKNELNSAFEDRMGLIRIAIHLRNECKMLPIQNSLLTTMVAFFNYLQRYKLTPQHARAAGNLAQCLKAVYHLSLPNGLTEVTFCL